MKEFFGTDLEHALKRAAAYYGTEVERLKFRLVEGVVPNSKRPAKTAVLVECEVERQEPGELTEEEKLAREKGGETWLAVWCQGILRRMGLNARLSIEEQDGFSLIRVAFESEPPPLNKAAMGLLRGSLQHLLARLNGPENESQKNYLLDLGGDFLQRENKMAYLAERASRYVASKNSWLGIHLLDYQDRRLLHLALKKHGLESESSGDGKFRMLQVGKRVGHEIGRKKQRKKTGRRGAGKGKVPDADRRPR